jgi:Zn-dependent oligopeptidase
VYYNRFILIYRDEAAEKLGFKNYGELSLITKMAPSISAIENTLMTILDKGIINLLLNI